MTTLDDVLDALPVTAPPRTCRVPWVLEQLPTETSARLLRAVTNPGIRAKAVSAALIDAGFDIGEQSIARHRRGDCRCPRA